MRKSMAMLCVLLTASVAGAAVTSTFDSGAATDGSDLPVQPASGDLIDGVTPPTVDTFRPGSNQGFHGANGAPGDQFPAYTDGGFGGGLHGLLVDNDPVVDGQVVQGITYDLGGQDVSEIRVFGGNADARQFLTLVVELSFNGVDFVGVGPDNGYFQPAGINSNDVPPGWGSVMRIFDDGGALLGSGVEKVRFQFFASGNNNPQRYVDPFSGANPFTGFDDGQGAANQSPLIREIDILPEPASLALIALGSVALLRRRRA